MSVPTKQVTVMLIKVKSCSALLCMLLLCICSYLKSVLRYKFFNFGYLSSRHSVFTWARMWESVVTFQSRKGSTRNKFGKHCCSGISSSISGRIMCERLWWTAPVSTCWKTCGHTSRSCCIITQKSTVLSVSPLIPASTFTENYYWYCDRMIPFGLTSALSGDCGGSSCHCGYNMLICEWHGAHCCRSH